tara:strand:- start:707 stop:853 length:147 start_codon:yes stop_codon:yes gene_type:complete
LLIGRGDGVPSEKSGTFVTYKSIQTSDKYILKMKKNFPQIPKNFPGKK